MLSVLASGVWCVVWWWWCGKDTNGVRGDVCQCVWDYEAIGESEERKRGWVARVCVGVGMRCVSRDISWKESVCVFRGVGRRSVERIWVRGDDAAALSSGVVCGSLSSRQAETDEPSGALLPSPPSPPSLAKQSVISMYPPSEHRGRRYCSLATRARAIGHRVIVGSRVPVPATNRVPTFPRSPIR
ncbi:hypothetical protein BZA05DRAFT_272453 [Tricharina praecox]|uniref:uncharacterized protein n=1 Tax=Tricharina praecox TaxID=43433 RepID=UPI00221F4CB6|nr:uncharacterized protein BZA05DRAFT_272453 [Tricharina praecox]KAI5853911.1 hypothetical protein BZA05DRAFT_272453 [Tricharina praecox]